MNPQQLWIFHCHLAQATRDLLRFTRPTKCTRHISFRVQLLSHVIRHSRLVGILPCLLLLLRSFAPCKACEEHADTRAHVRWSADCPCPAQPKVLKSHRNLHCRLGLQPVNVRSLPLPVLLRRQSEPQVESTGDRFQRTGRVPHKSNTCDHKKKRTGHPAFWTIRSDVKKAVHKVLAFICVPNLLSLTRQKRKEDMTIKQVTLFNFNDTVGWDLKTRVQTDAQAGPVSSDKVWSCACGET